MQSEDSHVLVDTHCHLDLEPLFSRLPEVLEDARRAGVAHYVVPGVHPDNWVRMVALAAEHPQVLPAFGIHPMHASCADDRALARLADLAQGGVAVGEIGLDPAYSVSLEVQEAAFRGQLRLAISLGLPVLVHCRKVFQRTLRVLREEGADRVGGIMHAFSGSVEMGREFSRLGFLISISGTVTWANAVRPLMLARDLPLESLVLETDAPDMTPQAFRGEPNQPAYLAEVLRAVAGIRGIPPIEVAAQTTKNVESVLPGVSPR